MNMSTISTVTLPAESIPMDQAGQVSAPVKPDPVKQVSERAPLEKTAATNDNKKEETEFSVFEAEQLAADLNEIMDDLQTSLGFFIREDLNHQVVVEIKNRETDELIKQIPSEEMLQIKQKMEELTGLIFDHTV